MLNKLNGKLPFPFRNRSIVLQTNPPVFFQPSEDGSDEIPPEYEASIGPTNAITGASEMTVNESSVVLDPVAGSISLQQLSDQDDWVPPAPEHGPDCTGGESALHHDLNPWDLINWQPQIR